MEILLGEDSIEMLEDLEFYSWIDVADMDRRCWLIAQWARCVRAVAVRRAGWLCGRREEVPDMEFLEYLGMWEESDEDWLLSRDDDGRNRGTERSRTGR